MYTHPSPCPPNNAFRITSQQALALPNIYTSQGINQLCLFLGHLRLRDKTANLILIDMSYLQLLTGSSTLFLNLHHSRYGNYIEHGWLVSIWKFLNKTKMTLQVRQAFIPTPPRRHDVNIMDHLVQHHTHISTLRVVNRCRIYLNVIFLSDI
jgi:hypothetical protein